MLKISKLNGDPEIRKYLCSMDDFIQIINIIFRYRNEIKTVF